MVLRSFLIGFFFFKQKTAYEMRISDWSSDVCSSDLVLAGLRLLQLFVEGRISAPGIDDVLTNGDTEESLSVEAIDDLCETVNCDGLCIDRKSTRLNSSH